MSEKISAKNAIEFLKFLKEEDKVNGVSAYVCGKHGEEYQVRYIDDSYSVEYSIYTDYEISEEELSKLKQMRFAGFRCDADIDEDGDFSGDTFDEISTSINDWFHSMKSTLTKIKTAWERFQKINREKNEN